MRVQFKGFKRARRSKYNNSRVKVDGHTFDSKKEAERYFILTEQQKAGIIYDLKVHPNFHFPPGFSYEADFSYKYKLTEVAIVEDVKGFETYVFEIKMKCFKYFYPSIQFRKV